MQENGDLRKRSSPQDEAADVEQPPDKVPSSEVDGAEAATGSKDLGKSNSSPSKTSESKFSMGELLKACSDDPEEDQAKDWLANYEKKKFSVRSLLPPTLWVMPYIRTVIGRATIQDVASQGGLPFSLGGDLIAGLTVGVMLVPQCLAFALLAGLPVQIGLYSSFAPLVAYAALGTIRQVQPGPTALVSLLTGQALDSLNYNTESERVAGAALCALLVGAISCFLGVIRFGFIVDFMSHSVMAAFCSAAGVTIASSQLKHLLGIPMGRKKYWWQTVSYLVSHLNEVHPATFAVGGTLLFTLLSMKKWKSAGSEEKRKKHPVWRWLPKKKTSRVFKTVKFVADLSSLLAVVVGWLWMFAYRKGGVTGVKMVGEVDGAGFSFVVPGKALDNIELDSLILTAAIIAVVGFLETMAVGGKFAMQSRYEYEPNQELLALGVANIAGAVMSGYPVTGSFSRTAVNAMLGATSLLSVLVASILVALAVLFLLPVIEYLPLASLAPIIIQGALGVIDSHEFILAFKASKSEFFVMLMTFVVSLALTVKEGLLIGFVLSILKTMNDLANPNLAICGKLPDGSFRDIRNFPSAEIMAKAVVVRMDARLSFANSRKMKEFCARAVKVRESQGDDIRYIVIDGKSINHVDLTGCGMLEMLAESLKSRGQGLIVANLKGPAARCVTRAGVATMLRKHGGHLCLDMETALAIVTGQSDGLQSQEDVKQLVKRADTAQLRISRENKTSFYTCSSAPKKIASGFTQSICSDQVTSGVSSPDRQKSPERQRSADKAEIVLNTTHEEQEAQNAPDASPNVDANEGGQASGENGDQKISVSI